MYDRHFDRLSGFPNWWSRGGHPHRDIDVANQNRTLSHVKDDTWITSKIRTNLLNVKGVSPTHIKVVTYNGTTYVMGILTPDEQQSATNTISTTAGVQKVITLYQTFNPVPANKSTNRTNS